MYLKWYKNDNTLNKVVAYFRAFNFKPCEMALSVV